MSILSVAAALVVTNLTPIVVTSASWTGDEWDHGEVGTVSCTDDGVFKTRGAGRLLGGELTSLDLDSIAALDGMTVTNDGESANPAPTTAHNVGDAYVNPLGATVLEGIYLPLTPWNNGQPSTLDDVLSIPVAADVGAVNHFAYAVDNGESAGASGFVSDSGSIQADNDDNPGLPTLGTLKLSTLVEALTGQSLAKIVSDIAELQLEIGAVASRATLDACETAWTGDIDTHLERKYAIAGLNAEIGTPRLIGGLKTALSTELGSALSGVQTGLEGLDDDTTVAGAVTSGVRSLLNGLLGGLGLGSVDLDIQSISFDAASVVAPLLEASISDPAGTVTLDLGSGRVQVDLASLLGEAYDGSRFDGAPGFGLNDLPPNTELVLNTGVTDALAAAMGRALDGWVQSVVAAVHGSILSAHIKAVVSVRLLGVASVNVTVEGSLQELLDGKVATNPEINVLGLCLPLVCNLDAIANALLGGAGKIVGDAIKPALLEPDGLVSTLGSTLTSTLTTAIDLVSDAVDTLLTGVFGNDDVNGLISLRVNVQNDPAAGNDPDPPLTYPDWEDGSIPEGRYDVAALSVSVLDMAGTAGNINLELARSSVGVSCAVGDVWEGDGRCAGY
ncbi:choice-of-anchor G family protein [Microbacterium sp.]|uniref:choice-of-anchor G family protein n=1 Tax=Microbacterium sp. TaxID=51671 RepID=UPI003F9A12BB